MILLDEPETHLHPRWQRTIVPSVIAAIAALRGAQGTPPQLLIATHAPLVLASVEPMFSPDLDELFHLKVVNGKMVLETGGWATQGDVSELPDVFGLEQARSLEARDRGGRGVHAREKESAKGARHQAGDSQGVAAPSSGQRSVLAALADRWRRVEAREAGEEEARGDGVIPVAKVATPSGTRTSRRVTMWAERQPTAKRPMDLWSP